MAVPMNMWQRIESWTHEMARMIPHAADKSLSGVADVGFIQGELEPYAVLERQPPEHRFVPELVDGHCVHLCLHVLTPTLIGVLRLELFSESEVILKCENRSVE